MLAALIGILLAAILGLLPGGAAFAQSRIITNGSFEYNLNGTAMAPKGSTGTRWVIPSSGWQYFDDARCLGGQKDICMAGWESTHGGSNNGSYAPVPQHVVEAGNNKSNNTPVPQTGNAEAELNADNRSRLYQNVCLKSGESITFSYYYSAETGAGNQQVLAGIWPRGNTGPTGGALTSQASVVRTTRGWILQTATLTAPGNGVYQLGFEAVLPTSGAAGNEIEDVSIPLAPLVDLGGSPVNALVVEPLPPTPPTPAATNAGASIKIRVNGRVPTGGMKLALRLTGDAVPDTDFRLGTPTGPYGTPTLTHTAGSALWIVNVPAGDYDAGLTPALNIGGITIPMLALSDLTIENPESAVFTLEDPGVDGSSSSTVWLKGDPVCSPTGAMQETASYTIRDNTPTMVLAGHVYVDANANNTRDGVEQWTSTTPLASTVYINVVKNNIVVASQSVTSGDGAWTITVPVDTDYNVVLSDDGANPSAAPPLYWQPQNPSTLKYTGVSASQSTLDFGLKATKATDPVVMVKAFGTGRLLLGNTTIVRFQINNSDGNPARSGIAFTDTLPDGLTLIGSPSWSTAGCSGTLSSGTGNQIALTGGTIASGTAYCIIEATVRGDSVGTKLNDSTRLSNVTGIYTLVDASVWVGTFYGISGYVYADADGNGQKGGSETGTGATWQVKLAQRSGATCSTPIFDYEVSVAATGAYAINEVPPGDYCLIVDNNATASDVVSTTPGWVPTLPSAGILYVTVSVNNLTGQNFGLFRGGVLKGRVFLDQGSPVATPGASANNGIPDGGDESGLAGVTVKAATGATVVATAQTDGAGNYTLFVPQSANGTTLTVTETNLAGYRSTGASVDATAMGTGAVTVGGNAYTYDRTGDRFSFAFATGTTYGSLDFGDVPDNRLTGVGLQGAAPGSTVVYGHVFIAGTAGLVSFADAGVTTPNTSTGWTDSVFLDTDCNGAIDAGGDLGLAPGSQISVTAGQQICLTAKIFVPLSAEDGDKRVSTLTASFTYSNAAPGLVGSYSQADTTTVGEGTALALTKRVRRVDAACAALASPAGDWSVSNQAPPDSYLQYQIHYLNNSADRMRSLEIKDMTPAFTTFVAAACGATPAGLTCATPTSAAGTAPAVGAMGQIRWVFTDGAPPNDGLAPGSSGDVTFCVRVMP
ncbi:hypothetical protein DKG74_20100 [Zavarzinia aquatilis]|uniref:DUF7933 domain-containing protein n=2 Tax=Zavarzinia aquatilis TaxID=2211142 RepID=A0A317DTY2_9PROT|nr:hypothetical protein DKG74_20100 [Zavarzinia aquatilis]